MSAPDFSDELAELFKTAEASAGDTKPETSETLETSKPVDPDPEPKTRAPRRRQPVESAPSVDVDEIRRQVTAEISAGVSEQIAQLQAQLAALKTQPAPTTMAAPAPAPAPRVSPFDVPAKEPITEENSVLIHFVDDGFTVDSQVFYRGQEVRVLKAEGWPLLPGREQVKRFRKVFYRQGPWDGEGFDLSDPSLTEADRVRLKQVMESSSA